MARSLSVSLIAWLCLGARVVFVSCFRLSCLGRQATLRSALNMKTSSSLKGPIMHVVSPKRLFAQLIICASTVGLGPIDFSHGTSIHIALQHAQAASIGQGIEQLEGEPLRIFMKAQSATSDGDFSAAQGFFEQVVEVEPNAIYAWSNLGNVLVSRGNLDQAVLCYKKAISLKPQREQLGLIVLNRASVEMSLGQDEAAIRDLEAAERLTGPTPEIVTNRAVALSNTGQWNKAATLFEEIIKTSDRDALPWWLRYSEALLETGRGTEAVAFLQRTLNRFPYEDDCKGFAVALYSSLGSKQEASRYWKTMNEEARLLYSSRDFQSGTLKWGPKTVEGFNEFLKSQYSKVPSSTVPTAIRQGQEISAISKSTIVTSQVSKNDFLKAADLGQAIDLRDKTAAVPSTPPIALTGVRVIDLGGDVGARGLASDGVQGGNLVDQLKKFGGPGATPSSSYGAPGYIDQSIKNPLVYREDQGVADQLKVYMRLQGKGN